MGTFYIHMDGIFEGSWDALGMLGAASHLPTFRD
jgi:hypothetical protein